MVHLLLLIIYLAFISLGLPDSVLGAAWPSMYKGLGVPLSYAGGLSMIIAGGTILSSLLSERLTKAFGTARVTAFSVAATAVALLGFAFSPHYWMLCLFAVPYGLGAGSVDAALNNDVALHYSAKHMSWLHCMWGIGATLGPYIMGYILTQGLPWSEGYLTLALLQFGLVILLFATLPLWKRRASLHSEGTASADTQPLPLLTALRLPGVKSILVAFFAYCALEQTLILWTASYLTLHLNLTADTAATFAALFLLGMTLGRFANGFLAIKYSDAQLIRGGQSLIAAGCLVLLLAPNAAFALGGILLAGLGCAPIYPCIIHSTPATFGADKSQAIIGMQMASAYIGTCLMPPLFGLLAQYLSIRTLPYFLLLLTALMTLLYRRVRHTTMPKTASTPNPNA